MHQGNDGQEEPGGLLPEQALETTLRLAAVLRYEAAQSVYAIWSDWEAALQQALEHQGSQTGLLPFQVRDALNDVPEPEQVTDLLSRLPAEERRAVLAWLELYLIMEEKHRQFALLTQHRHRLDAWTQALGLAESEVETARRQANHLYEHFILQRSQQQVEIPVSLFPLGLDFLFRGMAWWLYQSGTWALNEAEQFFLVRLMLVSCSSLLISSLRDRWVRRSWIRAFEKIGWDNIHLVSRFTPAHYTVVLGMVVFWGTIWYFQTPDMNRSLPFVLLQCVLYLFLLLLLLHGAGKAFPRAEAINEAVRPESDTDLHPADRNDVRLVEEETLLHSLTSRLDGYILEAALLGALAFSGFLQLIAEDLVQFEDIETFVIKSRHVLTHWATLRVADYSDWSWFFTKSGLSCLLCYESILCSVFFITVIASRLRFSDYADRIQLALQQARAWNDKEEALRNQPEQPPEFIQRLEDYQLRIHQQLELAEQEQRTMRPIVEFMRYFRNLGLLTFIALTVTAAFFVSSAMAVGAFLLFAFTLGFVRFRETFFRQRYRLLHGREILFRYRPWFVAGSLGAALLATVLAMLGLEGLPVLLLWLGPVVIGVMHPFIPARHSITEELYDHFVSAFTEQKPKVRKWFRSDRTQTLFYLRVVFAVCNLLVLGGLALMHARLIGGEILLVFGILFYALTAFSVVEIVRLRWKILLHLLSALLAFIACLSAISFLPSANIIGPIGIFVVLTSALMLVIAALGRHRRLIPRLHVWMFGIGLVINLLAQFEGLYLPIKYVSLDPIQYSRPEVVRTIMADFSQFQAATEPEQQNALRNRVLAQSAWLYDTLYRQAPTAEDSLFYLESITQHNGYLVEAQVQDPVILARFWAWSHRLLQHDTTLEALDQFARLSRHRGLSGPALEANRAYLNRARQERLPPAQVQKAEAWREDLLRDLQRPDSTDEKGPN